MSNADTDSNAEIVSDGAGAERGTSGVPRWPVVGVVLAVLWLFVRGVAPGETVEATVRTVFGEFLIGLAVGLPTAFALRRYYLPRVPIGRSLRVVPYAGLYLLVFVRELLTANLDVAYRVLAPSLPIRPDVIAVPLRVESDAAITTIANSITLTPGTLTMDHDAATNTLYVHAITARDRDSVVGPIRTWEDYALVIFEGRDPNTDVPRELPGASVDGRERAEGSGDASRDGADGDGVSAGDAAADAPTSTTEDGGGDPAGGGGDERGR